ncbi:hypothetical protein [Paraclostridium sordellii]|uniref:hypothetical protein n=1 Tax=Paraclostridium sordellii TaxID=1505 RepID=UPI000AE763FD|nr:hypothetical protein [Paeniclostridium sordellii]
MHISAKYDLVINGLLVYLEDKELNENYFCEVIAEYELGKIKFINYINKNYKVKI